ncbi:MerR family transcriptional regulator [Erythrobacter sp. sf7]|uniref:MerR family transcriptional regulator n=1 Tax=Erythrobacter fulvus TaxID=2987523 RepID=A0ABT5JPM3_9SPHN|nr:MerR family transcriptional regulator [Erythrobacter fulvus]MDC8754593.1 MerR family transcriptional regulator [Erythrobacter fulvus]
MAEFGDGKDEGALRTIGEVSEALGIKPHVLRYWEQQFPLLKPLKRSGGRRYYRPADVAMVEAIDRLVNREGYTLKGAEAVLRTGGKPAGEPAVHARSEDATPGVRLMVTEGPDVAEIVAGLKAVRTRLASALDA